MNKNGQWCLLHLSDWHLQDPLGGPELLRKDYYEEYIHALFLAIRKNQLPPIDAVCLTGDFVHSGAVSNFTHAKDIVQNILEQANVDKGAVVVCPGNHDYVRKEEDAGQFEKARYEYHGFANALANGDAIERTDDNRALLCKIRKRDIWVLSLDSTLGSKEPLYGPTSWKEKGGMDVPMRWVKKHLKRRNGLLVVLSHHPVEDFPGQLIEDEEDDFHRAHMWVSARVLSHRIGEWREHVGRTIWLTGDVHTAARGTFQDVQHVTAGRFGTPPAPETVQPRQAKVIQLFAARSPTRLITFEYKMPASRDRISGGSWMKSEEFIPEDSSRGKRKSSPRSGLRLPKSANAPQPSIQATIRVDSTLERISSEVENLIIDTVLSKKLYTLGRFETNPDDISLSWVSIGPLLNTFGLLPGIVRSMATWMAAKIEHSVDSHAWKRVLLVGIDCWGAVIASQLSIVTGVCNVCVASRGRGLSYTEHERVGETLINYVKSSHYIILVHDVVGSGSSLRMVYDKIQSLLPIQKRKAIRWLALSVICDEARDRTKVCEFLASHGTACAGLRMPIVKISELPGPRICPPILSFNATAAIAPEESN